MALFGRVLAYAYKALDSTGYGRQNTQNFIFTLQYLKGVSRLNR